MGLKNRILFDLEELAHASSLSCSAHTLADFVKFRPKINTFSFWSDAMKYKMRLKESLKCTKYLPVWFSIWMNEVDSILTYEQFSDDIYKVDHCALSWAQRAQARRRLWPWVTQKEYVGTWAAAAAAHLTGKVQKLGLKAKGKIELRLNFSILFS